MPASPHEPPSADWMTEALCATQAYRALPWAADGVGQVRTAAPRMRQVCDSCPVRQACERFVIDAGVSAGFWAGRWQRLPWLRRTA